MCGFLHNLEWNALQMGWKEDEASTFRVEVWKIRQWFTCTDPTVSDRTLHPSPRESGRAAVHMWHHVSNLKMEAARSSWKRQNNSLWLLNSWRRMYYVPPKRRYMLNPLHSIRSWNTWTLNINTGLKCRMYTTIGTVVSSDHTFSCWVEGGQLTTRTLEWDNVWADNDGI
jgi:hypothetical protein